MIINIDFSKEENEKVNDYLKRNFTKTRSFVKELLLTLVKTNIPVSDVIKKLEGDQIIFNNSDNKEMLRIEKDGGFYVNGKKVIEDLEVYKIFKKWLNEAVSSENIQKKLLDEKK
jgi:hypothetical protein|tara:strand:+ start:93 stop:437 length:345 start_codon:yes stop_codon:yes gene_type:complete